MNWIKNIFSFKKKEKVKMIKSFVCEGDVIEVLFLGKHLNIYKVEKIEVIKDGNRGVDSPTDFTILVTFSYNNGVSSKTCTIDKFKYVRHIKHAE